MNELKIFQYEGCDMTFELKDGKLMVNATEMAKPFKKETTHFLLNKQTKEFIGVLDAKLRIPSLTVIKGGNNSGTWMHQKLALKFAAWLSPEFELWVYDRIEELLEQGSTSIPKPTSTLDFLEYQLRLLREQDSRITNAENDIQELKAKSTIQSEDYYTIAGYASLKGKNVTSQLASRLGKAAKKKSQELNYPVEKTHSSVFGQVNTYHKDVLKLIM